MFYDAKEHFHYNFRFSSGTIKMTVTKPHVCTIFLKFLQVMPKWPYFLFALTLPKMVMENWKLYLIKLEYMIVLCNKFTLYFVW